MGSFPPHPQCVCVEEVGEEECVLEEGEGGLDFRGYAAFAMRRRVVDASHVEDDGAERLN